MARTGLAAWSAVWAVLATVCLLAVWQRQWDAAVMLAVVQWAPAIWAGRAWDSAAMITWHWHCSCGAYGSATANVLAAPGVATQLLGQHLEDGHRCEVWQRGKRIEAVPLEQWRLTDLMASVWRSS